MTAMTMPAIAPPLIPVEGAEFELDVGVADDEDEEEEEVPVALVELDVVVVEDVVCVAAMRVIGLKVKELAEGEAELKDEKVSLSWVEEMLVSVSCAVFQQMLI